MTVSVGSISEARRKNEGVGCVPIAASHDTISSVSFGEIRRSELVYQRRKSARYRYSRMKVRGDLRPRLCENSKN
jgi:hypothetical protein